MPESVIVVHTSSDELRDLCAVLDSGGYHAVPMSSLAELLAAVQESPCHAVILDFDGLPVDNTFFRELRKLNSSVCMIGISSRTFHPELEEALRTHISVCLSKPINISELFYWLKSFCGEGAGARASPAETTRGQESNSFASMLISERTQRDE